MKASKLREMVMEVLHELNEQSSTGTGASFSPGQGAQYATPAAFTNRKKGSKRAEDLGKKLGYKTVNSI